MSSNEKTTGYDPGNTSLNLVTSTLLTLYTLSHKFKSQTSSSSSYPPDETSPALNPQQTEASAYPPVS